MLNEIDDRINNGPRQQAEEKIRYPGTAAVIHGNGAIAYVMGQVCGGVIGYPITPSTEISEIFESFRAEGGCNVWGKHPFFFEPEGEHSAQSGALGAALTGGKYISNASSSQGILYGLESHYVTVGKKVGGFVLQVAARVVSRHSLNVMAGHDDVYALLPSGYTILFGSNPQEAADLAAISYKVSALSLIPVANAMDGFATSHVQSEALLPEPELLKEFLGDPESRIKAPTLAQELLFGAKGRVYQLQQFLMRHQQEIRADNIEQLRRYLSDHADQVEPDNSGALIEGTLDWLPEELRGQWRRQWLNAFEKGTRQLVPALVDVNNPGLTGGVQNQPDFQAGAVDHHTHFASEVGRFVRAAMQEYGVLTGRRYAPVMGFMADNAEHVIVALGSVSDDLEAVVTHLRRAGKKVGALSIKLLQPFPEAELVTALQGKKAVTVLERCDVTTLTSMVTHALFKAFENNSLIRHPGIPAIDSLPKISTGVFGLGAHDLQSRHLIAAFRNMESEISIPLFYLGSQFFSSNPGPELAALQARLRAAYPETEFMALDTERNPSLLPPGAFRIRFHSVGGYGTIATGKLLTDILAGVLGMHSKSAPKYGSEKSGAATNFFITLSPEPIKITNAELEEVEIVVSPDHKVFSHTNPLRGLASEGTFIMQSHHSPKEVWRELPAHARKSIREKRINFFVIDGFGVARKHAPTPDLEIRMMGIAFIGAVCAHVEKVVADASEEAVLAKIEQQIKKKFGAKGTSVVAGNMAVIRDGMEATLRVDYRDAALVDMERLPVAANDGGIEISASMQRIAGSVPAGGLFDQDYFRQVVLEPFKQGSIGEAPVIPGAGLFMPVGSAAWKDKGLFRLTAPKYIPHLCTGCMECALVCPDAAIPNTVHEIHDLLLGAIAQVDATDQMKATMSSQVFPLTKAIRESYRNLPAKDPKPFHQIAAEAVATLDIDNPTLSRSYTAMIDLLSGFSLARTRPFFDVMEKTTAGNGGLYSVTVDPWKCSGCLECVDVCGPGALQPQQQDSKVFTAQKRAFTFLSRLPNTAARFYSDATRPGGETKRLILDHANYYSMTGGHGGCRGCGEVTAIRLLTATNRAIHRDRQRIQIHELERMIDRLTEKMATVEQDPHDPARLQRMADCIGVMEKWLYNLESGPTGRGPSTSAITNATGCSSVYASTFPFNPYTDPWVNSLFQDSVPLAKGLFEGVSADMVEQFRAVRIAKLDLEDHYDPETHDSFFRYFHWSQFSPEELALMPSIISMGGDGATYDIGFGALSRLLITNTPIKVVVLNTGVYSNTGGQASTSSFTAQDSDLTRFGIAHIGKQEDRKELGLIAAFHPNVLVVQTASAFQSHFMNSLMEFLNYNESPALFDTYTSCMSEHGIADDAGNRRARLAVESRMYPLFVHDPRKGETLAERFSLDGNPDIGQDWTRFTIQYVDDEGNTKLKEAPFTPADFGLQEGRFKKHYSRLNGEQKCMPIDEYIELGEQQRHGITPFIWSTDGEMRLIKLAVSPAIVDLTEERRRNWRMLEYLSGLHIDRMNQQHLLEISEWQDKYQRSNQERENSIDAIARGMSELAAASTAPPGSTGIRETVLPTPVTGSRKEEKRGDVGSAQLQPLVSIAEEDMAKCTNCKTCYQDLSELFEKTTIVADGKAMEVSRVIPGALEKVQLSKTLIAKAARVADDCDAEIIKFTPPG